VIHNHYDRLIEVQDKTRIFIWKSLETAKEIKAQNVDKIKARCLQAATHNQQLLASMAAQWPQEFDQWSHQLTQTLTNL
jgi:hypothetical protein